MLDLELIKGEITKLLSNEGYELTDFGFEKMGNDAMLQTKWALDRMEEFVKEFKEKK